MNIKINALTILICIIASKMFMETQLSRQIIPRTKNGHAPPITQS